MIDIHLKGSKGEDRGNSFVDVAFGHNGTTFAGCHRFTVSRCSSSLASPSSLSSSSSSAIEVENQGLLGERLNGRKREEEGVMIRLEHFRCNPIEDKVNKWEVVKDFHRVYATVLFLNGVGRVLEGS